MVAWGITALESDAGLDILGEIRKRLPKDGKLTLGNLLESLQNSEWGAADDP